MARNNCGIVANLLLKVVALQRLVNLGDQERTRLPARRGFAPCMSLAVYAAHSK